MMKPLSLAVATAVTVTGMCIESIALASSHREAPFITEQPKVDGTDFYMFRSYQEGREEFVTLLADYLPLQDPYGGPNYFTLDPQGLYEIHVDNDGDGEENLTFQFRFFNSLRDIALDIGGKMVSVPLAAVGPIGPGIADTDNLNVREGYTVKLVRGDRRTGLVQNITNKDDDSRVFAKPVDNIGQKTLPDYAMYANAHIYDINIPACGDGRLFVGQRKEPFVVNLGETFDLVNTNPLGPTNGERNTLAGKNITTLALEVPIECLTKAEEPIIGGWTSASLPRNRILRPVPTFEQPAVENGEFVQVSRLGMPLVNEVVIGLKDKDKFNASEPMGDVQFADYVTHPTLPALLEALFGVSAPTKFPRADLVAAFLTGVSGLNNPAGDNKSEMLRLNTSIAPRTAALQNPLGVLAGDTSGFPNGRRPGDDVVDVSLRVAMGVLCTLNQPATFGCVPADAPDGGLAYTDGALVNGTFYPSVFPYLRTPIPGSPNN